MDVRIAGDPEQLGALTAATIARWLSGGGSLGLAGGSTPRRTYELLVHHPIDWTGVVMWMSDERWVPSHHERSNAAMASSVLVDHVGGALLEVPEVGVGDPASAAARYDAMLGERIGDRPDVVLLGLGDDGHTASLFPGTEALAERDRRFVANRVDTEWRLTATFPYLWQAGHLAFIVTGEPKADVVAEIIGGGSTLPGAVAAYGAQDTTWFIDEAAAGQL